MTDRFSTVIQREVLSKSEPSLEGIGKKSHKSCALSKYLLAYDADCGPCTRFKHVVDFVDSRNRIAFVSLVEADELGLLDKVPRPLRHASFHLIFPSGDLQSGAEALSQMIELFPLGQLISVVIQSVPGVRSLIARVYSVFSRLHDSGKCSYETYLGENNAGSGKIGSTTLFAMTFPA